MSWPGIKPRPTAWKASTLEKSHTDSLLIAIPNIYNLHMSPRQFNLCNLLQGPCEAGLVWDLVEGQLQCRNSSLDIKAETRAWNNCHIVEIFQFRRLLLSSNQDKKLHFQPLHPTIPHIPLSRPLAPHLSNWFRISLFSHYARTKSICIIDEVRSHVVLNEGGIYSYLKSFIKGSKHLQQAEYSDKKREINTDKYNN